MRRDNAVLIFILVVVLVFGLTLGTNQAWAQPENEEGMEEEEEMIQTRPNPMERPADLSAPAMKPGMLILPAEKVGTSEPAMQPGTTSRTGSASSTPGMPGATPGGPEVMDDGEHGDGFILKDGRRGVMQRGADGKMQLFLLQEGGKVLAPDGVHQLSGGSSITVSGGQASMPVDPIDPIDPVGSGGVVKSPGQIQIPGKMR